ncbi:MAG: hypothetical protein ACI8ZN_002199 [Bacteroidia bacterium]
MDTIILQRIILHNLKGYGSHQLRLPYALPTEVISQLQFHDSSSAETKELFKLMSEQINLINTPPIAEEDFGKYTETERSRSLLASHLPEFFVWQFQFELARLKSLAKYSKYIRLLPEISHSNIGPIPSYYYQILELRPLER